MGDGLGMSAGHYCHCGDGHWTYITNTPTNTVIMDWGMSEGWAAGCQMFLQGRSSDENLVTNIGCD